jgi:hypothetical protein
MTMILLEGVPLASVHDVHSRRASAVDPHALACQLVTMHDDRMLPQGLERTAELV